MKKERTVRRIASVIMAVLMIVTVSVIACASDSCNHSWNYTAMKNRIYAYCSNEGCRYGSEKNPAEIIITAENEHFTGYKYSSTKLDVAEWTEAGLEIPEIIYSGRENTKYAPTTVAPSLVGKYTASIEVNGKKAFADFRILKYENLKTPTSVVPVWASNGDNGELLGLDATMEYRIAGGEWKEIESAYIGNLISGEYEIRYRETENYEPSESIKVIIAGKVNAVDTSIDIVGPNSNSRYTESEFQLTCNIEGEIPAGCFIAWNTNSNEVALSITDNGRNCYVAVDGSGLRTIEISAALVDLSGNVVKDLAGEEISCTNEITLSNNFIETIIRIFKLFSFLNPTSLIKIK